MTYEQKNGACSKSQWWHGKSPADRIDSKVCLFDMAGSFLKIPSLDKFILPNCQN